MQRPYEIRELYIPILLGILNVLIVDYFREIREESFVWLSFLHLCDHIADGTCVGLHFGTRNLPGGRQLY